MGLDKVYHLYTVFRFCQRPIFRPGKKYGKDTVPGLFNWQLPVLRCWGRFGLRAEGQPRLLQIHLPGNGIFKADVLLLPAAH